MAYLVIFLVVFFLNEWIRPEVTNLYVKRLNKLRKSLFKQDKITGIRFIPGILCPFHWKRDAVATAFDLDENRIEIVKKFRDNYSLYNAIFSGVVVWILKIF